VLAGQILPHTADRIVGARVLPSSIAQPINPSQDAHRDCEQPRAAADPASTLVPARAARTRTSFTQGSHVLSCEADRLGVEEGKTPRTDNPVSGMGKNLPRKHQRERVLSLEKRGSPGWPQNALGYPFGPVYRLLLLTGCRPGEWSKLPPQPMWISNRRSS